MKFQKMEVLKKEFLSTQIVMHLLVSPGLWAAAGTLTLCHADPAPHRRELPIGRLPNRAPAMPPTRLPAPQGVDNAAAEAQAAPGFDFPNTTERRPRGQREREAGGSTPLSQDRSPRLLPLQPSPCQARVASYLCAFQLSSPDVGRDGWCDHTTDAHGHQETLPNSATPTQEEITTLKTFLRAMASQNRRDLPPSETRSFYGYMTRTTPEDRARSERLGHASRRLRSALEHFRRAATPQADGTRAPHTGTAGLAIFSELRGLARELQTARAHFILTSSEAPESDPRRIAIGDRLLALERKLHQALAHAARRAGPEDVCIGETRAAPVTTPAASVPTGVGAQ